MERALGEPGLVLCGVCMDSEEHEERWLSLRNGDDQALLGNYSVRACHGCRVSTLQLYSEKRDVWFILAANEYTTAAHGVERRVKTPLSAPLAASDTPVRVGAAGERPLGKRPSLRRKSSRFIKQHVQKEQMLALEWSLGNLPLEKSKHLWSDNRKRVEMEKDPEAYYSAIKPPAPDANTRPEPQDIFCATLGCRRFAKTGNRCRFHSSSPLVFVKPVVEANAASVPAK
ncbi:hypothetical protein PC129_g14582 [Phytophthora cactorum]|uniref:Uncharacterized protein n=1 Tax=Phytophthora cactorum TaxID=29920 RepID=A0A8T0YG99_9STRA|nr:hypothetical protein PC112_g15708 [Phytophthora cactorum]KAG2812748.1 hypothetical protein PC111_g14670 [Phytophthora cactorum]KAG2851614.1 hypothetical protein PC113_g15753 [Phytophthora cactorum]KAG2890695.1 hypothetical protein PC114_g17323 [Phytophthora cactorum]KAG2903625.1 hypothetical protein PC115_g15243 [Phytophthora cactorum]